MTADEKPEASHDYNFYLDRQLQNKLLEQDEILEASELYAKLTGANDSKTLTTKAAFAKADAIIGWINDSKVVLRKPDRESSNSNKNSNPIPNGYQMWKDARNKNLQDSYVFKHYYDMHGYIEQYRRDHTNVFIYRSPTSIQSMQGEGAQRYSQQNNNAPPVTSQVSHQQTTPVCSHCNSSNNVPNYLAALQYTNRCSSIVGGGNPYTHSPYSCYPTSQTPGGQSVYSQQTNSTRPSAHGSHSSLSQRNSSYHKHSHQPSSSCRKHRPPVDSASQAFKYKLAPETYWGNTVTRSESQNSLESDKTSTSSGADAKTSRVGSAKGGKTPTKVSVPAVPAIQNQIQTVSVQNPTVRAPETPISTTVRALDTLACVAGDKQQNSRRRGFSENFAKKIMTSSGNDSQEDDLGMFVSDDGSDDFLYSDMSDAISISQLSTACLGADVRVKRDTDDLEPSCTFHVFPNEYALDNTLSVLNTRSVTWYPASSSVLSTPKPPKKEWNNFQTSLKNFKREGSKDFQNELPGNPKDEHPHMEGMTWCEKLELLRSVNKRKEKPKTKVQKLTYFKESEDNPLPAPLVREATRAQLYEQRRIKHLLQQARMKGFNHFDWLKEYESQRFRHSGSTDSSSDSDSDNGEGRTSRHLSNCRMGYNDGVLLSRYNMKKSVKGDNRKAVPSINRTNTEIFQD
ncbi:hypothetical protein FSP39_017139 [Pinctada imbricata]|uniref:Uncharacterized protein n=1 Tax=Pinctada imbricata TaxID=66713 RepID=A0AA89BMH1_PINIB|nr:hypothetical protein FSP39_017139 [Pinctada imbricata]